MQPFDGSIFLRNSLDKKLRVFLFKAAQEPPSLYSENSPSTFNVQLHVQERPEG